MHKIAERCRTGGLARLGPGAKQGFPRMPVGIVVIMACLATLNCIPLGAEDESIYTKTMPVEFPTTIRLVEVVSLRGGPIDSPPSIVSTEPVEYPIVAIKNRQEGEVRIRVILDDTGDVVEATLVSVPTIFDQGALESVREWRFRPARRDGKGVSCVAVVPLRFRMQDLNL